MAPISSVAAATCSTVKSGDYECVGIIHVHDSDDRRLDVALVSPTAGTAPTPTSAPVSAPALRQVPCGVGCLIGGLLLM